MIQFQLHLFGVKSFFLITTLQILMFSKMQQTAEYCLCYSRNAENDRTTNMKNNIRRTIKKVWKCK